MKAGLRSRLARDPLVALRACRSSRRPLRRDWCQVWGVEPGRAERGNSVVEGELGRYPRDARTVLERARGAATASAARRRVVGPVRAFARCARALRARLRHTEPRRHRRRPTTKQLINKAPRRRPHSRPPPHASPRPHFQQGGSPRPNPWKRCRSTAAAAGSSAGRRGCRRAPR